jgi:hypothetical protein
MLSQSDSAEDKNRQGSERAKSDAGVKDNHAHRMETAGTDQGGASRAENMGVNVIEKGKFSPGRVFKPSRFLSRLMRPAHKMLYIVSPH